ncbi:MAG TPA: hypothetical protein VGQ42_17350 [Candidatus Dormibacteraeota bacterium]|nr:hypothetical protein [Candidatus Dormibacteraeota bacterium]
MRMRTTWRAAAGIALIGVFLGAAVPADSAASGATTVTVDRQVYVSDTPVDPYQNDQSAIHVAVALGTETARSFVHVDVNSLLAQGTVQGLKLTLVPTGATASNTNGSSAALRACMLKQPIATPFDASKPPAHDCSVASADGKPDAQGAWTFDLSGFVLNWTTSADTGVAIVPAASTGPASSWQVAFDKAKSTASADVVPAGSSSMPISVVAPAAPPSFPIVPSSGSATVAIPPPAAVPSAAAAPSPVAVAPQPSSSHAPAAAASTVGAQPPASPWWLLIVAGVLLLLVALAVSTVTIPASGGVLLRAPSWALTRTNTASLARTPTLRGVPSGVVIAAIVVLGFTTLAPARAFLPGQSAASGGSGPSGAAAQGPSATPGGTAGSTGAAQPSAAAGAGAAAAGGAGGAAAGAAAVGGQSSGAGSSTAQLYRGVTATTVSIGVIDNTDSSQSLGASGLGAAAIGDGRAQANAVIKDINAHGGIAGKTLVPQFHDVPTADLASNPSGAGQAACADLAQDHHVFAVVIPLSVSDATTVACFVQHDTPVIIDNTSGYDAAELNQFLGYMFVPAALNMTRAGRTLVAELGPVGYLATGGVYGVVAPDLPEYHRAVDQGLVQAMAARNLSLKDRLFYPTDSTSQQAFQNAVLSFYSEGIDHVISLGKQSQISFFMLAAEKQQYRPRYALSSFDNPQLLESIAPAAQLNNAVGIGWNPLIDTDTRHSIGPVNASAKRCSDAMAASGVSNSTGNAQASAFDMCDVFFLLQRALAGPQDLSSAGLLQAVNALGSGYSAPDTFQVTLGPNKHDGADAVRDLAYDGSCGCFLYRSGNKPAS